MNRSFVFALCFCLSLFFTSAAPAKETAVPANTAEACVQEALLTSGPLDAAQGHALINACTGPSVSAEQRLIILDVRTPEETAQGHIQGAVLIPLQELETRLAELPEGRPALIICRTGRRAEEAWNIINKARPHAAGTGLWYLKATPEYTGGGYIFR